MKFACPLGQLDSRTYPSLAMTSAVSSMRFEKPHSLSYHDSTRTKPPSTTWVWRRSKVELAGLWLKSPDTSGWPLGARMPASRPLAASPTAWLVASTVVALRAATVKSIRDTLGGGTRIDVPSSLPLSWG